MACTETYIRPLRENLNEAVPVSEWFIHIAHTGFDRRMVTENQGRLVGIFHLSFKPVEYTMGKAPQ